ncbi:hypothetical protein [Gordonia sp. FQ]|uniref:hypothetical protein n=1 Tax=Gordonia sp. FQ TaxID=3446634 RepID=UPI003F87CF5D
MNGVMTLAGGALRLAADQETKGPEFGKASPIGLLAVIVLLLATFLLIRSMNKQLRKLPDSFDSSHPEPDQAFDEGTDTVDEAEGAEGGAAASAGAIQSDNGDDPGR